MAENAPQAKPEGSGQTVDTHVDTVAATPALEEAERARQELARKGQEALAAHDEAGAEEALKAKEKLEEELAKAGEPKTDTGTTTPEATGGDPDKEEGGLAKDLFKQFLEGLKALFAQIAAALGLTSGEKKEDEKDKDKKGKGEAVNMEEEPVDIPDAPIVEKYDAVHSSERLAPITHIILHTSDGRSSGANLAKYLADPGDGREVSSHFVVDRNGDLYQTCALGRQAWHTEGKDPETGEYYNQESIGIDLANYTSGGEPFNEEQYAGLAKLISYLMKKYSISFDNIIGHQEVDDNRGDPGDLFDWKKLKSMIEQRLV